MCIAVVALGVALRWNEAEPVTPLTAAAPEAPAAGSESPGDPPKAAPAPKPASSKRAVSKWHDGKSLTRAKKVWNRADIEGLLEKGGDPNERRGPIHQTPLLAAAQYHVRGFVIPLLEAGADPLARNVLGKDALHHLTPGGSKPPLEDIRAVVERIRPPQDLSVIDLIRLGNPDQLDAWLDGSPDLEQHWDLGRTPLLWATYYGRARMARALIAAGSRTDVVDYRRNSPLHFAAMNGDIELAHRLIALGVPMNAANAYAQTPLALSLYAPDTAMLSALLRAGADPCLGPHGRSDVYDLADAGMAPNRERARALLEPAVASHACSTTPQAARRRNLQEFIDELALISPPPAGVVASPGDDSFSSRDRFWAGIRRYNREMGTTLSVETYARAYEERRRHGYRALLARPDDEWFVEKGSVFWRQDLRREDLDLALAIENLRITRFFHLQNREACPLCDPDEYKWANGTAVSVRDFARRHLRKGRVLAGLDLCEKFLRERGGETTYRYVVYQSMLTGMFILGRVDEALQSGEAELDRTYGDGPKRYDNKVGWMVTEIRRVAEETAADPRVTKR